MDDETLYLMGSENFEDFLDRVNYLDGIKKDKEIERLNNELELQNIEMGREIERLNKVIKEYDNWLDEQIDFFEDTGSQDNVCAIYSIAYCKLQEIKENINETRKY